MVQLLAANGVSDVGLGRVLFLFREKTIECVSNSPNIYDPPHLRLGCA